MPIQIPPNAPLEVQNAFREVSDALDRLTGVLNLDLKGKKVINAGKATDGADYVTRDDVVRMIRAGGSRINSDGTAVR